MMFPPTLLDYFCSLLSHRLCVSARQQQELVCTQGSQSPCFMCVSHGCKVRGCTFGPSAYGSV